MDRTHCVTSMTGGSSASRILASSLCVVSDFIHGTERRSRDALEVPLGPHIIERPMQLRRMRVAIEEDGPLARFHGIEDDRHFAPRVVIAVRPIQRRPSI